MTASHRSLVSGFLRSAELFPDRPALLVEKRSYRYGELREIAASWAAALDAHAAGGESPFTGILALRSLPAFAGVLAALMRGHGYVPLNRDHPPARISHMIRRSGCRALVADRESAGALVEVAREIGDSLVILLPELDDVSGLRRDLPAHVILGARDVVPASAFFPVIAPENEIAYIIFTSGSTGTPKGVTVAHRNVNAFIDHMVKRYAVNERDRFSHMFALTFDGSVLDLFTSWAAGACVCCPSRQELLNPGTFVKKHELTLWCSVPSIAVFMKKFGALKPGNFPSLRWTLFGAEALTVDIVESWRKAAPHSGVENVYGPTEVTCVCMIYRWDPERSPRESRHGMVPIGTPNPGLSMLVCDASLREVEPGETGELLVAGPQVAPGYLDDPERTAKAFVVPPGRSEIYYRTGDLVRRPRGEEPVRYLGRIDYQIKVLGHRVELEEIEAVVREESGIHGVVAFGWPMTPAGALGIEVFVEEKTVDEGELRRRVATKLPEYMVPKRFHPLPRLPLNDSGKIDRGALRRMLEEMA